MSLTIIQEYQHYEYGFAEPTVVRFVISNDYQSLFNQTGDWNTDIVALEEVSQDLNLGDMSFAVNQLTLKLSAASCVTEQDFKTLFFFIGASDKSKYRFCAVFINPTFTAGKTDISTLQFIGRVSDSISADDLVWQNQQLYTHDINAIRNWSFKVNSFDITILDDILMHYLYDGYWSESNITEVPDVSGLSDGEINAIFEHKPAYFNTDSFDVIGNGPTGLSLGTYYRNLGTLYSALRLLLDRAENIIEHMINVPDFTIELVDDFLGFEACPVKYKVKSGTGVSSPDDSDGIWDSYFIDKQETFPSYRVKPQLSNEALYALYIHKYMLKSPNEKERSYNFQQYKRLSDLLFGIARSLGCYIMFEYVTGTHIRLKIISRINIPDTDFTYIIGANSGKLDLSSENISSDNIYRGLANPYCEDGLAEFTISREDGEPVYKDLTGHLTVPNKVGSEPGQEKSAGRLLLSTSATLQFIENQEKQGVGLRYYADQKLPQNTILKYEGNFVNNLLHNTIPGPGQDLQEFLHTGLYMRFNPFEIDIPTEGWENVWRPLALVFIRQNGKSTVFKTLAEFISSLESYDRTFYKYEREYAVPFWSGFAKMTDGSDASINNLKLGSKIKFLERQMSLNETTNEFVNTEHEEVYIVVSIKRKLGEPMTTIKLHRQERYAYSDFDGDDPEGIIFEGKKQRIEPLPSVRCAYTSNVSLSGLIATDGITPVAGDTVLVSNNTDPKQNGVYTVGSGAWVRTGLNLGAGGLINVREGTANGGSYYMVTSPKLDLIIDSDDIPFKRIDAAALTDTSGIIPITKGGTGATNATSARSNLGLGTMATQASNSVSITGGSITGLNALSVTDTSDSQMSVGVNDSASMTAINNGTLTLSTSNGNFQFNTTGASYEFNNSNSVGRMYLFFTAATSATNVLDITKSNGGHFAVFEYLKTTGSTTNDEVIINSKITSSDGTNAGSIKYITTTTGTNQTGAYQFTSYSNGVSKNTVRLIIGGIRIESSVSTKHVSILYAGTTGTSYSITLPNNAPTVNNSVAITNIDGTQGWSLLRQIITDVDIPSIGAGSYYTLTLTVTGVTTNQNVYVNRVGGFGDLTVCNCYVSAADTVIVRLFNGTASAIDLSIADIIVGAH